MTILITGAAGFIGSHLVDKLLLENYEVICLDNFDPFYDPNIKRQNVRAALTHKNYTLVEGDIRDTFDLQRCFAGRKIDLAVHLAAMAGVRPSIQQPKLYYDVNVTGTLSLFETMRSFDVKKCVFASSSSIYGNNVKVPFSESDAVDNPISPYAATKKSCELLCHTYHHLYGFDLYCLRFFTAYGPRQRPEMAIHNFARNIMEGKPIIMYGDGSTRRDYTYVDDIVSGIISAIQRVKGYEIVNLGESRTTTLIDLIRTIERSVGEKAIIQHMPEQPGDVKITYADIQKARKLLDYSPATSIEDGINKFVSWMKNQR